MPQLESANYHELANFRKHRSNFRLASILAWSLPHIFLDILDISNEAVAIRFGMFDCYCDTLICILMCIYIYSTTIVGFISKFVCLLLANSRGTSRQSGRLSSLEGQPVKGDSQRPKTTTSKHFRVIPGHCLPTKILVAILVALVVVTVVLVVVALAVLIDLDPHKEKKVSECFSASDCRPGFLLPFPWLWPPD